MIYTEIGVTFHLWYLLWLSSKQFFGQPMFCTGSAGNAINLDSVNKFCWMSDNFYTYSELFEENDLHKIPNLKGLGIHKWGQNYEKLVYPFLKWIPLIVFRCAIFLYLPTAAYSIWEGNLMGKMTHGLKEREGDKKIAKDKADELHEQTRLIWPWYYYFRFLVCNYLGHLISLTMIVSSLTISTEGCFSPDFNDFDILLKLIGHIKSPKHPKDKCFPTDVSCDYWQVGPSGTNEKSNYLCHIPSSNINQLMPEVLFQLYYALFIWTILAMLHTLLVSFVTPLRKLINAKELQLTSDQVNELDKVVKVGEYFLLNEIKKNVSYNVFKEYLKLVTSDKKMEREEEDSEDFSSEESESE